MPSLWTSQLGVNRTPEEQKKFDKRAKRILLYWVGIVIIGIAIMFYLSL